MSVKQHDAVKAQDSFLCAGDGLPGISTIFGGGDHGGDHGGHGGSWADPIMTGFDGRTFEFVGEVRYTP